MKALRIRVIVRDIINATLRAFRPADTKKIPIPNRKERDEVCLPKLVVLQLRVVATNNLGCG